LHGSTYEKLGQLTTMSDINGNIRSSAKGCA
jgi:hypothetical protein